MQLLRLHMLRSRIFSVLIFLGLKTWATRLMTLTTEVFVAFFLFAAKFENWKERENVSSLLCVWFFFSSLLSPQLQKRKEREEQMEDVIQAYEKIHMEKNNLQRDLDKMVRGLAFILEVPAAYNS